MICKHQGERCFIIGNGPSLKEMDLSELGIDPSQGKVIMEKLESATERSGAKMLAGSVEDQVTELVKILKEDEKVL